LVSESSLRPLTAFPPCCLLVCFLASNASHRANQIVRSAVVTSCFVRSCFESSDAEYPGPAQQNRI
jgi:hypothetical protein